MSRLERYLKERDEQSRRKCREVLLEKDSVIEEMLEVYDEWKSRKGSSGSYSLSYDIAKALVQDHEYTPHDVEVFSLCLCEHEDYEWFYLSGFFLSALVNEGEEESYSLITEHLSTRLHGLGYRNSKHLIIQGDAGQVPGSYMEDGSVTVLGDAGTMTGFKMSDGYLTVHGDCERGLGAEMRGGTISVNGHIESISPLYHRGNIFHKGKRLRPREDAP